MLQDKIPARTVGIFLQFFITVLRLNTYVDSFVLIIKILLDSLIASEEVLL